MSIFSSLLGIKKSYDLDPDIFAEKILSDKNAVVLDVRTQDEYRDVRIPNSKLIDIYKSDFLSKIEQLDKSKSYYIYCRSGNRSGTAVNAMTKLGFTNVFHLQHGIMSWNGKVERG